jgi:hypothetical protein
MARAAPRAIVLLSEPSCTCPYFFSEVFRRNPRLALFIPLTPHRFSIMETDDATGVVSSGALEPTVPSFLGRCTIITCNYAVCPRCHSQGDRDNLSVCLVCLSDAHPKSSFLHTLQAPRYARRRGRPFQKRRKISSTRRSRPRT